MSEQETYTQPSKVEARRQLIRAAVTNLSSARSESALVRIDEFNETLNFAMEHLARYLPPVHDLLNSVDAEADLWRQFHSDQVGSKEPRQLKVLFLAGPEPMNDIEEFTLSGVRPENIWAVEGDKQIYKDAVHQLRAARARVKIFQGSLQSFLERSTDQFDIVYYDACGPLPGGRPNTLHPLVRLFTHGRLADLCALVTNFCAPPPEKATEYSELLANFFAVRYDGIPRSIRDSGFDPAETQYDPALLYTTVRGDLGGVYSDFVTRFIVELFRCLFPWWRVAGTPEFSRTFFANTDQRRTAVEKATRLPTPDFSNPDWIGTFLSEIGDVHVNPSGYPLTTFLRRSEHNVLLQNLLSEKYGHAATLRDAFQLSDLLANVYEGH